MKHELAIRELELRVNVYEDVLGQEYPHVDAERTKAVKANWQSELEAVRASIATLRADQQQEETK